MNVTAETDYYHAKTDVNSGDRTILLTERGDTVTENIIMAAALSPNTTIIRNASPKLHGSRCLFLLEKVGREN